jgi:hypothetical protein
MGDADDIRKLITSGTKKWTKQKKAEERNRGARRMRSFRMRLQKELSLKDAAAAVMEKAYLKASTNGTLPANARQVMYAARGEIQAMTGKPLDDQYFTQTLLPNYIKENRLSWDIVFDDRGHFIEPHSNLSFGLGTINVRNYLASISRQSTPQFIDAKIVDAVVATLGPPGNFGALLFIEKEGFDSLLKTTKLAQRYDIATMSSKGMSVTAARRLAEGICARYGVTLLILHDFDRAGMIIKHTLHTDTRRYTFTRPFDVIDLGLRLDDVEEMDLESEDSGGSKVSDERLVEAGCTPEEIAFLADERVELNAMPSDQFIEFLESKLEEHDIKKIVPDIDDLNKAYAMFAEGKELKAAFADAEKALVAKRAKIEIPEDLKKQVEDALEGNPEIPWHRAVHSIIDHTILNNKSEETAIAAIVTPNKSKQDGLSDLKPASAGDPVPNEHLDPVRAVLGDIDPKDDAPPF